MGIIALDNYIFGLFVSLYNDIALYSNLFMNSLFGTITLHLYVIFSSEKLLTLSRQDFIFDVWVYMLYSIMVVHLRYICSLSLFLYGFCTAFMLQKNYIVLKEEDIRRRQEDDIVRISAVLSIPRVAACMLLRQYKWWIPYISYLLACSYFFPMPDSTKKLNFYISLFYCQYSLCFFS